MGEEVRMTEYEVHGKNGEETNGDDERILDWEMGLPNGDELTPLSQSLIPPELATAFSITPIQYKTSLEVNRASQTTLSSLRGSQSQALSSTNKDQMKSFNEARDPMVLETDETDQNGSGSESRRSRKPESPEEADSALRTENSTDDPSARTLKRPRLVWTPQLHKRFVDVVGHLGIKNAVPKTIMQLMNVEGLTRENVASHLQKYRLYLKRMQGLPNDDPSSSDQLFSSTPVPPHLHYESGANSNNNSSNNNGNGHVAGAYGAPAMMSVPMYGMMNNGFHPAHGFEPNMFNMNMNMGMNNMLQQRDWSVNKHGHGSVMSYQHHVAPRSENEGAH